MKYFTGATIFKFSWDQVASGLWHRYPNPYSTHVISEDTVTRKVFKSKLYTTRLLTKQGPKVPRWGERFVPNASQVFILEESVVDPKEKTITTYTRNIGSTRVLSVEEKCVYRPSSDNTNWTVCDRQAWISSSVFGFSYALQTFGFERFKQSAKNSAKGFEVVLNHMFVPETIPEQHLLNINTDKFKVTAKKATELAKSKATAVAVGYSGSATSS